MLRIAVLTYLIYDVNARSAQQLWRLLAAGAGVLVLLGLWTPVSSAAVAIVEMWLMIAGVAEFWLSVMVTAIAAGLAMLGPGAWSLDARLFGRKRISIGNSLSAQKSRNVRTEE